MAQKKATPKEPTPAPKNKTLKTWIYRWQKLMNKRRKVLNSFNSSNLFHLVSQ